MTTVNRWGFVIVVVTFWLIRLGWVSTFGARHFPTFFSNKSFNDTILIRAWQIAVKPDLSGEVDLVEDGMESIFWCGDCWLPQPDVDADEQMRLYDEEESTDAVDCFLQFVQLAFVVRCLQTFRSERTQQQRQEQIQNLSVRIEKHHLLSQISIAPFQQEEQFRGVLRANFNAHQISLRDSCLD